MSPTKFLVVLMFVFATWEFLSGNIVDPQNYLLIACVAGILGIWVGVSVCLRIRHGRRPREW